MAFGVTEEMIEEYGEKIFQLSLNVQHRTGDPVRHLDFDQIEKQRANMGLSDAQIAEQVNLTVEQTRFIRVIMERRRYRNDQYRKLFNLGGGRRYRSDEPNES
jgi:hypothetical protein